MELKNENIVVTLWTLLQFLLTCPTVWQFGANLSRNVGKHGTEPLPCKKSSCQQSNIAKAACKGLKNAKFHHMVHKVATMLQTLKSSGFPMTFAQPSRNRRATVAHRRALHFMNKGPKSFKKPGRALPILGRKLVAHLCTYPKHAPNEPRKRIRAPVAQPSRNRRAPSRATFWPPCSMPKPTQRLFSSQWSPTITQVSQTSTNKSIR